MPSDPIVNDHFADILWMNGKKYKQGITGICFEFKRYENDLKNKIYTKILNGSS